MTLQQTITLLTGIHIRKATPTDYMKVAALGRMTFVETFGAVNTKEDIDQYVHKAFHPDQIKKEIEDANNIFLLAFDLDRLVGYAKLRSGKPPKELKEEKAIEIQRIYTRKSYLGKKVGKHLMEACLDLAHEMGYDTTWLGVWEYNPRAIAFYEKWGFKKFGQQSFMLGFDEQTDILMKRSH